MRLTLPVSDATFSGPFLASRVSICVPSVPHAARAGEFRGPQAHGRDELMLRGPRLTPHKIRAERSSNLSFQKLRGPGLTPHFHDERSSNLSEFFPLLASFPSSIVARSIFIVAHSVFQLRIDHRYFNQGTLCGRAAALRVCTSLLLGTTTLFLTMST